MIICFNSIKVRLRLMSLTIGGGLAMFQFHKGAIKTHTSDVPVDSDVTVSIP